MKNIDIIRGYRTFGHEDLYASDAAVTVVEGDIIGMDGSLVTLTSAHVECGMAVERNTDGSGAKPSGKIPVYISNFVVKTKRYEAGTYAVNAPVSVKGGKPTPVDATNTIVWGYIQKIDANGDLTIRCNY